MRSVKLLEPTANQCQRGNYWKKGRDRHRSNKSPWYSLLRVHCLKSNTNRSPREKYMTSSCQALDWIYDFYWFLVSIEIGLYFSVQFSPCLASHAAHFIKSDESKKGCHGTGHQTWSTLPHVVQVSCDWRNPKEFWPESIELLLEGSMGHCQFRRGQHSRAGQRLRYMIETKEKRNTCFNHFGIQSQQQHDLGTPKTRARTKQLHKLEAQSAHMFKRAC